MFSVYVIMRFCKNKFFVLTFVLLIVYLLSFYFVTEKWFGHKTRTVLSSVRLSYVVVHIDLKGSPPKLNYLVTLLPKFKHMGVNGILMEYEDMFPYEGKLVNISAGNCYNKTELKEFLNKSARLGIEIIPLIQTFGHMEHALKLHEFRHLREESQFPDSICPSKHGSGELITDMLTQVIHFHTTVAPLKHIHIGCDEVFHLNMCQRCRHKNVTDIDLFMNHIQVVNNIIKILNPNTGVLIWDDMLRDKIGLQLPHDFKNIEPVYWDYTPKLQISHANLYNYHKNFKNIWIASAFKGADGRSASVPDIKSRFMNNLSWLDFIVNYKFGGETNVYNFKGIILTGWSRYSHMDPLCELLPASMPSLILNLLVIQTMRKGIVLGDSSNMDFDEFFQKYLVRDFNKTVQCTYLQYVDDFDNSVCSFENSELYNGLKQYFRINLQIKRGLSNEDTVRPFAEFYSQIQTLNMNNVPQSLQWCSDALKKLLELQTNLKKNMAPFYEDDVIEEYLSYKKYESEKKVKDMIKILKNYLRIRSWERRPIRSNISAM